MNDKNKFNLYNKKETKNLEISNLDNNLINDSFFLIVSDNLEDIQKKFYGFAIVNNEILFDKEKIIVEELDGTGSYIYINREDNKISIYQDFSGCYGLYIYEDVEKDFFAISNSFLKLTNYLKEIVPLSLDEDYANCYIPAGLVSFSFERTLINEIKVLPPDCIVNIDIFNKTISYSKIDYGEKSVDLDSKEGLMLLDKWFEKWVNIFNSLYAKTNNIQLDLSGGFDTRVILSLILYSNINLSNISIHTKKPSSPRNSEDFEIANKISDEFGFKLNEGLNVEKAFFDNLQTVFDISLYTKLGFSKHFTYHNFAYVENVFTINGYGGGLLKAFYRNSSIKGLIASHMSVARRNYSEELVESTKNILEYNFKRFDELNYNFDHLEHLFMIYYRLVRNRNWFGKNIVESFISNENMLCPLMDPLINSLKGVTDDSNESYLLHALILVRYYPDLLKFGFEGGRKISKDALNYVNEINRLYPCKLKKYPSKDFISRKINSSTRANEIPKFALRSKYRLMQNLFETDNFKNKFLLYYSEELYDNILRSGDNKDICAAISIIRIIDDLDYNKIKLNNYFENWFEGFFDNSPTADVPIINKKQITYCTYHENLKKYIVGRFDIRNIGGQYNDIEIMSISDEDALILKPIWITNYNGSGFQIESSKCTLNIKLKCINDGNLVISLKSKNVTDKNKKRLPIFIDFKNFKINSDIVFNENAVVSHDNPYSFVKKVKNDEIINLHIEWEPFNKNSYFK